MSKDIIVISGGFKSGKDEVLKILNRLSKEPYVNLKFASFIKEIVANMLQCNIEYLEDQGFKNKTLRQLADEGLVPYKFVNSLDKDDHINENTTVRFLLQYIGTEIFRDKINRNIHIATALTKIKEGDKAVFTDGRFINEIESVKAMGGISIRVNRLYKNRFPKAWKKFVDYRGGSLTSDIDFEEEEFLDFIRSYSYISDDKEIKDLYQTLSHTSETSLNNYSGFDIYLDNNGTIEELETQIINKVLNCD